MSQCHGARHPWSSSGAATRCTIANNRCNVGKPKCPHRRPRQSRPPFPAFLFGFAVPSYWPSQSRFFCGCAAVPPHCHLRHLPSSAESSASPTVPPRQSGSAVPTIVTQLSHTEPPACGCPRQSPGPCRYGFCRPPVSSAVPARVVLGDEGTQFHLLCPMAFSAKSSLADSICLAKHADLEAWHLVTATTWHGRANGFRLRV